MEKSVLIVDTSDELSLNRSHVWGNFREKILSKNSMCRIIHFYKGGMTSVHRHPVNEILFVEEGSVKCLMGTNLKRLQSKIIKQGQSLEIPSMWWHSCGCKSPMNNKKYSLAFEMVTGKISEGKYRIEKAEPAVKSVVREKNE